MKGYLWGIASLFLVSMAQLLMKWSVMRLPTSLPDTVQSSLIMGHLPALIALFSGIGGYALSMVCWFFALRRLPLNRAYSLLGLSYALVYLAAACLPVFNEPLQALKSLGAILIVMGVGLINYQGARSAIPPSR